MLVDLTGDGHAELVVNASTQPPLALSVFTGGGQGSWTLATVLQPSRMDFYQCAAGRLAPGSPTSVVVPDNDFTTGTMGIRVLSYGSGTWTSTYYALDSGYATGVLLADFDGDGVDDVLLRQDGMNMNGVGPRLRLFHTAAGPSFVEDTYSGVTAPALLQLTSGDFDGDGWPDLAGATSLYGGGFAWLSTKRGAHPFGQGCSAGLVAPAIAPVGAPQLGNATFAVVLSHLQAGTWGFAWFGFDNRRAGGSVPLPLALDPAGAPGCSLLVDPLASSALFVGPTGTATWPVPLPPDPAFHRLSLYAQGATLAPSANALGALFSGGLALRLD